MNWSRRHAHGSLGSRGDDEARSSIAILVVLGAFFILLPDRAAFSAQGGDGGKAPAASANEAGSTAAQAKPARPARFDIDDFAVEGADKLSQLEVEEAIYPFLGPGRTVEDVEKARAALEKAYHDKGFQTVAVSIPPQSAQSGVIVLKVVELKVGRLRVKNSRFFDIDKIKDGAPSLKEGTVPNLAAVSKDIVALNQWPDRRVTPALRAGVAPGTVDVDLNVDDTLPFHASAGLDNRRSPNTTALRATGTVRYENLWQLGHSVSFTYQVAPGRRRDMEVFSGSYLARIPGVDGVAFLFSGLKSTSDVATVGGVNVVGPGETVGARAVISLPPAENFYHSLSVGLDYKRYGERVRTESSEFSSPIRYFPFVLNYGGAYQTESSTTQLNASLVFNFRPPSADEASFDRKRAYGSGRFIHFNLDLSHLQELPLGFQAYGRFVGQIADGPLVSSEQISVAGLDNVRGYLESEVLGDNGLVVNAELRSPDIGGMLQDAIKREAGEETPPLIFNEGRLFGFYDKGVAEVRYPAPEEQAHFDLSSFGFGARLKMFDHVNGLFVYSTPMVAQTYTRAKEPRVNFRLWGEF